MGTTELEVGQVYLLSDIMEFQYSNCKENLLIRTPKNYDFFALQSTGIKFRVTEIKSEFNHRFSNDGKYINNGGYTVYYIEEVN